MELAESPRSLDNLYKMVNSIYLDRNYYRDRFSIFSHLVEVVGGLSYMVSEKRKKGVEPQAYVAKALAWWFALCGKVGVRSVEDMIWIKFPRVCPYCQKERHDDDLCQEAKSVPGAPLWERLKDIGKRKDRPLDLPAWQIMFAEIYPLATTEKPPETFAKIVEELGELGEALRVFDTEPGYFLSEAPDVFAWLMHLQNLVDRMNQVPIHRRGQVLLEKFNEQYPGRCIDCRNSVCICPPVLPSTLGRIAREVPPSEPTPAQFGVLLPIDKAIGLFEARDQVLSIGDTELIINTDIVRQMNNALEALILYLFESRAQFEAVTSGLLTAAQNLETLTSMQRVTQESIDELVQEIASLPSEERETLLGFLVNIAAAPWTFLLIEWIRHLAG